MKTEDDKDAVIGCEQCGTQCTKGMDGVCLVQLTEPLSAGPQSPWDGMSTPDTGEEEKP